MKYSIAIFLFGLGLAGLVGGIMYPTYISEIFLGMLGPMLISILSILTIKHAYNKSPQLVTAMITKSFFIKMVIFAAYFILILNFYAFEPIPFVISFTCFFTLFYIIEAIFLQKLFQSRN